MTISAKATCPERVPALLQLVGIFQCLVDKYLVWLEETTREKRKSLETKGHKVVLCVLSPLLRVSLVLGHVWNSVPNPVVLVGRSEAGQHMLALLFREKEWEEDREVLIYYCI